MSQACCFKCKASSASIPSRDGVSKMYCVDCFTFFCSKLFRDTLFSQCALPSDEVIAVGVSGGIHSMFLLHQLGILKNEGLSRGGEGHTKLLFFPFHLREDELIQPSSDSGHTTVSSSSSRHLSQFASLQHRITDQAYQWKWSSEALYAPGTIRIFTYKDFYSPSEISFLRGLLHSSLSLTCREELYHRIRQSTFTAAVNRITAEYQSAEGPSRAPSPWLHFLTGSGALRCGVEALYSLVVAGGGGAAMVQSSGFRSYLHNVVHLRPLRMLLPKEILFYNRIWGIGGSYTPSLSTGTSSPSFKRVLETFLYESLTTHRAVLFNVLSVTTKVDLVALGLPLTAAVLNPSNGVELMNKKRMVFARAKHHHHYLSSHPPPVLEGTRPDEREGDGSHEGKEKMCVVCGIPISSAPSLLSAQVQTAAYVVCVSCRECINEVFLVKNDVTSLEHWMSVWGERLNPDAESSERGGSAEGVISLS